MTILRSAFVVLATLSAGSLAGQTAPNSTPIVAKSADTYLRSQVRRGFSGVVLVARGDSVLLHTAYSADPRVTTESAFWIGSLTKPFTAAAILKLQEEGRLSVRDSVSRFIAGVPADKRGMTIHQLLTHTSGLGHRYASEGITSRDEAARTILALPMEHGAGEYSYSNDGYSLLAAIVSIVSGTSYEDYLRRNLLEPAGMAQSGFWGEPATEAAVAPVRRAPKREVAGANWGYRGATGLRSTARDIFRWHQALLGDAVLGDSAKALAFATQVQRAPDAGYGYGWQVLRTSRGTRLITHTGGESGIDHYSSLRRYVDEGVTIVVLSNAPEELTWEVHRGLISLIFAPPAPAR
ncbi:MAG TPA: serine hydrolase domain-containing protein [Longimicrobium sp.]|jgi:CubicO group peptidase (beta-lactamase class C family)